MKYIPYSIAIEKSAGGYSLEQNSKESPAFTMTHDSETFMNKYVRRNRYIDKHKNILEKALSRYGLSPNEVKTYLYLAGVNEKGATEISESVSLHRTETYKVLRDLEKKGLVLSIFVKPVKFVAVPPHSAINHLLETQKIKVRLLESEKTEFLALWSSIPKGESDSTCKETVQTLEGRLQTISKAKEMLERSKQTIQIFAPDSYLTLLYQCEFVDRLRTSSYDLEVELVLEDTLKGRIFGEEIGWSRKFCLRSAEKLPCFMISDRKELLTIYRKGVENPGNRRQLSQLVAVWTNCAALVESMAVLFHELTERKGSIEREVSVS